MYEKLWLVYMIIPCEMGSEGWSGWSYYAVVKGETDEEIFGNWVCEVITIYNVNFLDDIHKNSDGSWSCRYYSLEKIELPRHIYGHAKPLGLSVNYESHNNLVTNEKEVTKDERTNERRNKDGNNNN